MRRRTPPLIPGKVESAWLTTALSATDGASATAATVREQRATALISDGDALSLAGDLVQLLRFPGSLPELPPDALPRLMHETAATVLAAPAGEGRAARPVTIGGFGSLLLAAACLPLLPEAPAAVGGIVATQALSAVLGLGVRPMLVLAGTASDLPEGMREQIVAGARAPCAASSLALASGRRLQAGSPACVVLAVGYVPPARFGWRGALPGDCLIVAKALGTDLLLAAWRAGRLSPQEQALLLATATQPLTPGPLLACLERVHAQAVAGQRGLLGALLELCSDASLSVGALINITALPVLPAAHPLAADGVDGAARRNLERDGARLAVDAAWSCAAKDAAGDGDGAVAAARLFLAGAAPGGNLLVCCAAEAATEVLAALLEYDFGNAAVIGQIVAGERQVTLAGTRAGWC
ncbi:AIR synthase-related protein [Rhodocyclus tenuis]|uniref:Selenophosphate synthase n=1 Tax=Rhodocyclus tenuis TaxID=1066 RepID=A0A840G3L0_RHOTE|nr:AIR synthase-related protein [Rhodocyclus tenuis]MBB4246983.1 selenophosphate synthase [Rhodocyclus tenuis]